MFELVFFLRIQLIQVNSITFGATLIAHSLCFSGKFAIFVCIVYMTIQIHSGIRQLNIVKHLNIAVVHVYIHNYTILYIQSGTSATRMVHFQTMPTHTPSRRPRGFHLAFPHVLAIGIELN